jgi:protein gp37
MSIQTSIEWTEQTWNPAVGCSKVSPGYAGGHGQAPAGHESVGLRKRLRHDPVTQSFGGAAEEDEAYNLLRQLHERYFS